jgi:hypothetical protein
MVLAGAGRRGRARAGVVTRCSAGYLGSSRCAGLTTSGFRYELVAGSRVC